MTKYAFYATTSQSGSEGKNYTHIDIGTHRQTYKLNRIYIHTYRNIDYTPNWTGIWFDKNKIGALTGK